MAAAEDGVEGEALVLVVDDVHHMCCPVVKTAIQKSVPSTNEQEERVDYLPKL